jgi:hypothetical protein
MLNRLIRNFFKICIILILIISPAYLYSQNITSDNKDTIFLVKGSIIYFNDTSIIIHNDTVILLPKETKFKIRRDPSVVETEFYDSLKTKSSRFPILGDIINLVIAKNEDTLRKGYTPIKSEQAYSQLDEKTVKKIRIKRLSPFGTSVYDTSYISETWAEKTANKLHITTIEKVIRSNLIFSENDKINSYIIAENERILRNRPYLYEVKFYSSFEENDSTEITLVTRDLWSIGIKPDLGSRSGNMEIYDLNFLGLGNTLSTKIFYDKDSAQKTGFSGQYLLTNIRNSFIDGSVFYSSLYNKENYGINISRSFNYLNIKHAGGILVERTNDIYRVSDEILKQTSYPLNYYQTQIWVGKSWNINNNEINKFSNKLIISTGYYKKYFLTRPYVSSDSNKLLHNSDLIMLSLTLSKRNYYKSNLIYAFGTIEDIPYGYLTEFTYGREKREFSNRNYYGFQFAFADFAGNLGYIYTNLGLGGYLNNKKIEQATIKFTAKTFSNLYYYKNYKFRNFATIKYLIGINRFEGEFINLDENIGEKMTNKINGTQKLSFDLETVSFTPANFYGFKSVLFGYWDIGVIGSDKHFILTEKYFLGAGLGMRIRNDNLVFQTFQLKIAYYPIMPNGKSGIFFSITGQDVLKLFDFITEKPGEIDYK